jgi:hypothetical protein
MSAIETIDLTVVDNAETVTIDLTLEEDTPENDDQPSRKAPRLEDPVPEAEAAEPEAVAVEPEDEAVEPEAMAEPEDEAVEPEAMAAEPEDEAVEPEDEAVEPEAVAAEPEAVFVEPNYRAFIHKIEHTHSYRDLVWHWVADEEYHELKEEHLARAKRMAATWLRTGVKPVIQFRTDSDFEPDPDDPDAQPYDEKFKKQIEEGVAKTIRYMNRQLNKKYKRGLNF